MPKKTPHIHLHTMPDEFGPGIAIAQVSLEDLEDIDEINQVHRDAYHVFFLQERGTSHIVVDFQDYNLTPYSIGYIHPMQVHRVAELNDMGFVALMVNTENLNPEYAALLQSIAPVKPLSLTEEAFALLMEAASLCIKIYGRKDQKLYYPLLKDSCNALVGLIAAQFMAQPQKAETLPRFDAVTKAFKAELERSFITRKRPAYYAQSLSISVPYLNECVKNNTGHPVTYHIAQRVVLEAKRLLVHSGKSVKEIAADLGYDDYPYFSRLFTKTTGMTALVFRSKYRD